MKRALVTGATGYIGSRLVARLRAAGWDVHVLVRPGSRRTGPAAANAPVSTHRHDSSPAGMERVFARARPDAVFHLASLVMGEHAPADVTPLVSANVLLGARLAEAAVNAGTTVFVNTGTYWQSLDGRGYDPVNLYAATKQAFEDLLVYYAKARGLRTATLVLFDVYGPADPRGKLLGQLEAARRTGRRLDLSPGRQSVDMIHVDDAVEAYLAAASLLAARPSLSGRRWAVSGGRRRPLREIVSLWQKAAGPAPVRFGGRPYRPREVFKPWNGPRLPGWRPRVTLTAGLAACADGGSA